MIKFFGRIRQNLLNEGKTSKYFKYAIGEIVLVMIGILLALQVNNWNEQRKDRDKEATMLKELREEFLSNKDKLISNTKQHQKCFDNINKVIELLPVNINTVDKDSLGRFIERSLGMWTFDPSQGIINALINSSDINLISNTELRNELISWQSVFDDYHEDEVNSNKFTFERFFPYLEKHFDYNFNFHDTRTDLTVFETFEFENMMKSRALYLNEILFNQTNELETLKNTIDKIIDLTNQQDSRFLGK